MKNIEQFFIDTLMWKFHNTNGKTYQIVEVETITVNSYEEVIIEVKLKPYKGKVIRRILSLNDIISQYSE
jgi:hypothetical protein